MPARLPTHLLVSAALRAAMAEGVNLTIIRKGDAERGAVLLILNRLNGACEIYEQIWQEDAPGWACTSGALPIDDAEATARAQRAAQLDPDLWLIEIEDKMGRLWFQGKVRR